MNPKQPESRHHQTDWETYEYLEGEANELQTAEEPNTTRVGDQ